MKCTPSLVALAVALNATPTRAADLYVALTGSNGPACPPAAPCRDIQYAVDEAAAGDAVHVAAGTYVEQLTVRKALSITGAGAAGTVIDGGGIAAVVQVWDDLELTDVTVRNGRFAFLEEVWAGGVHQHAGRVVVERCRVLDSADGTGIWVTDGVLTLTDSVVSGHPDTGVYFSSAARGTVTRSVISDNVARGNAGGISGGASLIVRHSLIEDNTANYFGGGLVAGAALLIEDSTIRGNATGAAYGGGALLAGPSSDTVIRRSTLSDNWAEGGGAIRVHDSPVTILDSTLSGNTGVLQGGAIYVDFSSNLTILSSTIVDNVAEYGGGILLRGLSTVRIGNTVLARNSGGVAPDCGVDLDSELLSNGYNLIGHPGDCTIAGDLTGNIVYAAPGLGPLADNGGPTETHLPLVASLVIDAGDPAGCGSLEDQRGTARPQSCGSSFACDIGAVELDCGIAAPDVYESDDPADITTAVGFVTANPHEHVPAAGDELYYRVDDGAGLPSMIYLVAGGAGILIHF